MSFTSRHASRESAARGARNAQARHLQFNASVIVSNGFTVDSDGRHVVEGTGEPMFPVAAVALITLSSRP